MVLEGLCDVRSKLDRGDVDMINKIPEDVKQLLKQLENNGYEAYLVGGAVRDIILGLQPKDYDIATNALPNEVKKIFKKTIPTGEDYGTITVMINDAGYEITTYRKECDYDGRRPKAVSFANTIKEDLSRRDFTINAIAMSLNGEIVDPFYGRYDLECGRIRCVGNTEERFKEDKLRILRAFRFASRYNFEIHPDILWEARENGDISKLSKERICSEFNKIIMGENPKYHLTNLSEHEILHQIISSLECCYNFDQKNKHHNKDVFEHILDVVNNVEKDLELRLAALFHDIGKPQVFTIDTNGEGHFYEHAKVSAKMAQEIMEELRYPKKTIENVRELVYWHMVSYKNPTAKTAKKFINKVGIDRYEKLLKLQIADRCASKPPFDFEDIYKLKFECEKVLSEKQPMSIKDLKVNGHDMMELGLKGKEIRNMLDELLEIVLTNPKNNKKDLLINCVKQNLHQF